MGSQKDVRSAFQSPGERMASRGALLHTVRHHALNPHRRKEMWPILVIQECQIPVSPVGQSSSRRICATNFVILFVWASEGQHFCVRPSVCKRALSLHVV